jgi:hypothetical protein
LSAAGLTGCYDVIGEVRVFNHSGQTVVLKLTQGRRQARDYPVPDGKSHRVRLFPERGGYRMTAGGCDYTYRFAGMQVNHPFGGYDYAYPVNVQIEPDFTLQLLPYKTKAVVPAAQLGAMSKPGFPLKPASKTCPPAA